MTPRHTLNIPPQKGAGQSALCARWFTQVYHPPQDTAIKSVWFTDCPTARRGSAGPRLAFSSKERIATQLLRDLSWVAGHSCGIFVGSHKFPRKSDQLALRSRRHPDEAGTDTRRWPSTEGSASQALSSHTHEIPPESSLPLLAAPPFWQILRSQRLTFNELPIFLANGGREASLFDLSP